MGKIAEYLRSHLDGEITDASDVREHFANDAGLISITPQTVAYPYNEQDVRKIARFAWQLAEKGRHVSLTPRGYGSDWSGGAVGDSIILAMTAHMNKILELDSRKGQVVLEPGATFGKVNQTLLTHGLFLPFEPLSSEFSSIAGGLGTNAVGNRSSKYGSIASNTPQLKVVLSNGEIITTGKLTKREVNKRMGLATFEGEIYRGLDAFFNENADAIASFNGINEYAPINIFDVRRKDGSVDLTPLFIGSQGTLGIITEARMGVTAFNPNLSLALIGVYKIDDLPPLAKQISAMGPSVFTIIPKSVLQLFASLNPMYVAKRFGDELPEFLIMLEFDSFSARLQKKSLKRIKKLCSKLETTVITANNEKQCEEIDKFYRIANILIQSEIEQARVVPGIDSCYIPADNYLQAHQEINELMTKVGARYISWYDYQLGVLRYLPYLDIRQLGQRQKLIKIMEGSLPIILKYGGLVGINGGGRVSATYHKAVYGDVIYDLMVKIKQLFDPYNILNPGVIFNVDTKALSNKMKQHYSHGHRHNHLPR